MADIICHPRYQVREMQLTLEQPGADHDTLMEEAFRAFRVLMSSPRVRDRDLIFMWIGHRPEIRIIHRMSPDTPDRILQHEARLIVDTVATEELPPDPVQPASHQPLPIDRGDVFIENLDEDEDD